MSIRPGYLVRALPIVLSIWTISGASGRAETIALARLESGQKVVATFSTWGCFHYRAKYKLVFVPDPGSPGGAVVQIKNIKWLRHKTIATRRLSPEELQSLDLGLAEYRTYRRGGCISTNLNQVRLKFIWHGELITEEMYHGNSCNVHSVQGAIDLEDLIFRRREESSDARGVRHNHGVQPSAARTASLVPAAALRRRG